MAADWKKMLAKLRIDKVNEQKEKEKITDEKLVPRRIIEIILSKEDGLILKGKYDTRRKYVVIISNDNDRYLYATFLINSESNELTTELSNLQYPLRQKDYPHFLKHKSTLDCSQPFPIDRTRLKLDGKDKGLLSESDFADALVLIKNSETIEPKIKKKYNLI